MPKFTVCKELEYVTGHLRYGHAAVEVEAETEEEALTKAEEYFDCGDYDVVVDDYEIDDCGSLYGDAYIE